MNKFVRHAKLVRMPNPLNNCMTEKGNPGKWNYFMTEKGNTGKWNYFMTEKGNTGKIQIRLLICRLT